MANTTPGPELPDSSKPFDPDLWNDALTSDTEQIMDSINNVQDQIMEPRYQQAANTSTPGLWNDALAKEVKEQVDRETHEDPSGQGIPEWALSRAEWERRLGA